MRQALAELRMPSGMPVRKVRLLKKDLTIQPIRKDSPFEAFVKPGRIHHACLFEWEEGGKRKRDAEYVTMLEAARRLRDHEPVVRRAHSTVPQAKFLMSLSTGDSVLARVGGCDVLMVVSTLVSTQKRIHLVQATDGRRASDKVDRGMKPNTFDARKVTVDPLGRIRWAND